MRRQFSYHFLVALLVLAFSFTVKAQDAAVKNSGSIVFLGNSFKAALHQAQMQHKFIFVDAYASWCGPCKMLKTITFHNKKAADFYNENFINVSIDMEKDEGPDLATAWGITAYPTLIIFDSNGKAILGTVGYLGAEDLIRFGKQALGGK